MKQKQRPTSDRPRLRVNAGQALVALQALQKLAGANFPAMEAFQIAKAIATLNADTNVVAIDRTRHAMAKKHGVEKDGMLSVPPEKMPAFLAEYGPVADASIEVDLAPLPFSILEHAPEMTPAELMALEPFLAPPFGAEGGSK